MKDKGPGNPSNPNTHVSGHQHNRRVARRFHSGLARRETVGMGRAGDNRVKRNQLAVKTFFDLLLQCEPRGQWITTVAKAKTDEQAAVGAGGIG